jgi:hypothetical protein
LTGCIPRREIFNDKWPALWTGPGRSPRACGPGRAAAVGRRFGSAQRRELAAQLRAQKTLLLAFTEKLEEEYLKLGSALQAMVQRANDVERAYDKIHALTTGQGEDAPIQFSFQLLKKAEDLVFSCYDQ